MQLPFDAGKLRGLMEERGLDLVIANTRHNVRYLTGGYFYHFHALSSRMGTSQYLPFACIPRGRPEDSFYVKRPDEGGQIEAEGLWIPNKVDALRGTLTSAAALAAKIRSLGMAGAVIGLELPFLPADAYLALRRDLPEADFVDATPVFDELRAIKSEGELAVMRSAYARLADSIHAAFLAGRAGITTKELEERTRVEMTGRGLGFLFALVCAGPSFLRAPSSERWEPGHILHIDAGGEDRDYIADICRMASLGEPSGLAKELHRACIEVQDEVRRKIRPGLSCRELPEIGARASAACEFSRYARFVVHGIGLVPYEQPVFDPPSDRPLETGMVLSIETDFLHPGVGHVKIEDAVAVTPSGCEGLGDFGRDWTILES